MSKQLVVCCDGTWNVADERRSGSETPYVTLSLGAGASRARHPAVSDDRRQRRNGNGHGLAPDELGLWRAAAVCPQFEVP
jgi:hypothetical protein